MSEKAELEHIQVGETDEALVTLQKLDISDQPAITEDERTKVKRMIDWRLMPIVLLKPVYMLTVDDGHVYVAIL
jgi:hypothetical protein